MKTDFAELEKSIQDILAAPEYQDHPASKALSQLWEVNQEQWSRMDRLTRLSDSYQDIMLQQGKSLSERFDKHVRQLEKMTRISDRYQRSLRQLNIELEKTSLVDPLTELPNRRMIMKRLAQAFDGQQKEGLSVAMIDIDYFKKVNDEFGHQVGDNVLIALGRLMESVVGDRGVIGRWGGEEFLVILTRQQFDDAVVLLELLRSKVSSYSHQIGDKTISTSVSIGMTEYQDKDTVDSLLLRADSALYSVKSKGRNSLAVG